MELQYDSDSDSDIEILHQLNDFRRYYDRPYIIRDRENHWDKWDDIEFIRRFRVSKTSARTILSEIEEKISHPTSRNEALNAMDQLLLALRFYATGSIQQAIGDFTGVHQTTAGRAIKRVTEAIAAKSNTFVKLNLPPRQQQLNHNGFYSIARFPRVYGALDCTHVRIQSPGLTLQQEQKGYIMNPTFEQEIVLRDVLEFGRGVSLYYLSE
ncbi:uncharacterized protein LOC123311700 [Coccinella septempunctata]|uniref:uncharacterized protein LOC123311700 n=1 Tax=Coccinella septempunctata TaxID=41139 RepID=UPI001D07162D|nr:uncharacterized protein LOC123311700 [Coccinella septempunctata]